MSEYRQEMSNLRQNKIVMESLHGVSMAIEGRERLHFINRAVEAVVNPTRQADFLNKLFTSLRKVDSIDFGKIPDSKGDITKYVYYRQMYDCIQILNSLMDGEVNPVVDTMNKLHQILLDARQDYVFGFKTNNFLITTTYNLMVTTLYEMINVSSVEATDALRTKLSIKDTAVTRNKLSWIVKTAEDYVKFYESGQWAMIVKEYKKAGNSNDVAAEADVNISVSGPGNTILGALKASKDVAENVFKAGANYLGSIKTKPSAKNIIPLIVALLFIIRRAIYFFFSRANKLSNYAKDQAELLRISIDSDPNDSSVQQKKTWLQRLEKLRSTIESKLFRTEKEAAQKMKEDDKATFTNPPTEETQTTATSNNGFDEI